MNDLMPSGQVATPVPTIEQALYEKRQKIYPRQVHGRFATLRVIAVVGLLGIYYGLPWLRWQGQPVVLLDLPARKFHIFGLTLWPQDFLLLTLLLIGAALSLFLFTTLAGRLWCGYACPQTVWTEVFLWLERVIEGTRQQRMKLDQGPWNARKWRKKLAKQGLWIAFSLYTGFTFVAYFTPAPQLWTELAAFALGPWETFWFLFYSFATYGNAGFLREQVCKYMCPYARFQSAMFDADTLVISYDRARGEPRGSRRAGSDSRAHGLGDCINCTLCVHVCPTGIDIRDGLQYECIGCSSCVDVCDDVMDKMGYARGLVRYTTQHELDGQPRRIARPRALIYLALLIGVGGTFVSLLLTREPYAIDVIRDRNQLYREHGGLIENVYTLKVLNFDEPSQRFGLSAHGLENMSVDLRGHDIEVASGTVAPFVAVVRAPESALARTSSTITFTLAALRPGAPAVSTTATFLGPAP